MSDEPKIGIFYEKFYTDDTGRHIPDLFGKNNYDSICVKSYWGNTVDAFFKYQCLHMFTAIQGDFRIVTAYESGDGYKFNQFFLSGLDGKVVKIPKNTWFGINNLNSNTGIVVMSKTGNADNFNVMDDEIFDWYARR